MTELLADRKEQNVCWGYLKCPPKNINNILNKAIMESSRSPHTDMDSADLRTGGRSPLLHIKGCLRSAVNANKRVRIARKLSGVEPQVQKRNFPSVEQIQDASYRLNVLTSYQRGALCISWGKMAETRMNTEFCGGGGAKL